MNNMEEQLWQYIDGTCSEEERMAITAQIEKDESWRKAFNDMVDLNADVTALTLDEPPMNFSYNVMEGIRAFEASKPLKTSVNKYFIGAVAGFFVLAIIILLVLIFKNTGQDAGSAAPDMLLPDLSVFMDSGLTKAFIYFDIMLLLFMADAFFRRAKNKRELKTV